MDEKHNKYKGEVEQQVNTGELLRSGKGEMFYFDGSSYKGEWRQNKRHGFGECVSNAKDRYEGFWFDD